MMQGMFGGAQEAIMVKTLESDKARVLIMKTIYELKAVGKMGMLSLLKEVEKSQDDRRPQNDGSWA